MSLATNKKVSLKRVRPNPLFEDWVANMYEEAKSKKSKLEPMLKEALDSLSKYPAPLKTGAECIILKGFGKELCRYLDKCLERYNSNLALSQYCDSRCDDENLSRPDSPTSTSSSLPLNKYVPRSNDNSPTSDHNLNCGDNSVSQSNTVEPPPTKPLTSSQVDLTSNSDADSTRHVELQNSNSNTESANAKTTDKGKKKAKNKSYKPAHRSGGYAILVTLLEQVLRNPDKASLTKEELIEKAQQHSEESFVRPKPETFYTAWSNMTRLVSKGLVKKIKRKKVEYILTEEGIDLARELMEDAQSTSSVNDIIFNDAPSTSRAVVKQTANFDEAVPSTSQSGIFKNAVPSTSQSGSFKNAAPSTSHGGSFKSAVPSTSQNGNVEKTLHPSTTRNVNKVVVDMMPGTFDIILLIDKNETGGLKKKNDPTVAQFNKFPDLKHEYRSLKVGDFTWVARNKVNQDQELVLPFVVERKRMDDLGASIKDGRFHEQKFRLRKCGLENVIYMVENYGKNKHVGLPLQSLMQALANTRVQDGFKVHVTDSLTNSARFLAMMTKRLTIRFKDKHLRGCSNDPEGEYLMTFEYFNKSSAKTKALTVTETFIKLLLQLKGVSVEKALAITNKYPTPRSLIHAYVKCDRQEGECLLAHLKYGDLSRNVGPITSKSIYQLFSSFGDE